MKLSQDDIEALELAVEQNYIRKAIHSELPLTIYNYTPKTQFESFWTPITKMSRGLVTDNDYNIIIKCPEKFFNYGEDFAADIDLNNAKITEKLDGYYISIKLDSDLGLIITSRGSFDNQYIEAAEQFITDDVLLKMVPDYTYFCELLQDFPGDEAIILTKHPEPKLVCWAIKDKDFNEVQLDNECPFPTVRELSLAEAKQYLEQKVEGVVAQDTKTFERVKIKTEYYILHHRILADCTKKKVWEILSDGGKVEDLDIPDEFMKKMLDWQTELNSEHQALEEQILQMARERQSWEPKMIALDGMLTDDQKSLLFTYRRKGKEALSKQIWKYLKPRNVV